MARGRHARRRLGRSAAVAGAVAGALLIAGGGVTYGAFRYDRANVARLLPGVEVGGVDVSSLTRDEAIDQVREESTIRLSSQLRVIVGKKRFTVTPQELGMTADVEGAVDQALALSGDRSFLDRVWHRLRGEPIGAAVPIAYRTDPAKVSDYVAGIAKSVSLSPRDASIDLVSSDLVLRRAQTGRALETDAATTTILQALSTGATSVSLPLAHVAPKVTNKTIGRTIVVDLSENRLYLYDGFKVDRTYPVATAMPGFTTPVGSWQIVNKAANPTWYNPAPDGWGAGEPLSIPPGPGDPLGTRALYLNAPDIRIHGTYDTASVGTYASHGCIRMYISDSEALYPLVQIGTKVIIKP